MGKTVGEAGSVSWRESLGVLLRDVLGQARAKLAALLAVIQLLVWLKWRWDVPAVVAAAVVVLLLAWSVVDAYHGQRVKAAELAKRICGLERPAPRIVIGKPRYSPQYRRLPDMRVQNAPPDRQYHTGFTRPGVWYVEVANQPAKEYEKADLVGASVCVEVRPESAPDGFEGFTVQLAHWNDGSENGRVTLRHDGVSHRVNLIAKFDRGESCYLVADPAPKDLDSWHSPAGEPYRIPPGTYDLTVAVRGLGLLKPQVRRYRLDNDGQKVELKEREDNADKSDPRTDNQGPAPSRP